MQLELFFEEIDLETEEYKEEFPKCSIRITKGDIKENEDA